MSLPVPAAPPGPPLPSDARCALHPLRPAADRCPVCARPRCDADAASAPGGGCPACEGVRPGASTADHPPPTGRERLVRAALAAHGAAVLGGVVAQQYVEAPLFRYLTPFVVGVLTAAAAQSASGSARTGPEASRLRGIAVVYATLAVALGFVLEKSTGPLEAATLLPYAAAVAGVVVWTLPPKARKPPEDD